MVKLIRYLALGICLSLFLNVQGQANFAAIDRHARKAPANIHRNLPALTTFLTEPAQNNLEKVRAIYVWMTHHISYDEEAYNNGTRRINQNIADILRRKKAVCFGYATLFQAMCAKAGLEAEIISGYSKGTLTAQPNLKEADHAWNAVWIDDQWYLLDATWGSSLIDKNNAFVEHKSDTYFLTQPQTFILAHLPNLPMWQLLDCPVSPQLFEQSPDSIRRYLSASEPCYSYADSIRYFTALEVPERRLWEMKSTYKFNPTSANRENLGHSLIDYASAQSDQAEVLQNQPELADSLVYIQARIIALCEHAFSLMKPYDWQKELYIGSLLNQAVSLYQQTDQAETPLRLYQQALEHLATGKLFLDQIQKDNYFVNYARQQCNHIREAIQEAMKR